MCGFLGLGAGPDENGVVANNAGTYNLLGTLSRQPFRFDTVDVTPGCGPVEGSYHCQAGGMIGPTVDWYARQFGRASLEALFEKTVFDGNCRIRMLQDPMTGTAATMNIEENMALAMRRGQKRGLRWGITRPNEMLGSFQPMLVVSAHSASARDFSATHYNASLVLSMKFKYFVPYIGGGVDYTTLHINQADNAPELVGDNEYAATARATVGLNFKLPSYLDLSLAANYAYYGLGAEASVSLRF